MISEAMGNDSTTVSLRGRDYKIVVRPFALLGAIEKHLKGIRDKERNERLEQLRALRADMPDDMYREMLREILQPLTDADVQAFMDTAAGAVYVAYLSLSENEGITYEWVESLTKSEIEIIQTVMNPERIMENAAIGAGEKKL